MNALIQKNRNLKNRKGFTLIELIVVIAILGILAAVLVPQLGGFTDKAKQAQVLSDAAAAATAADALYIEKNAVPTGAEIVSMAGISGTVTVPATNNTSPLTNRTIVLFTYTLDGKSVTRDDNGEFK
jgi:prepilin-type N-terminal cleavage/methylation domain-containing protein